MKVQVLASTKPGYELPVEDAIKFSGKEAGICYMPDNIDTLFSEPEEKTLKRANGTLKSGHHSVFGHPSYCFAFEEVPKIIAMILNNEKDYNTSEKSARYTKMKPSPEEEKLYEKWIEIYEKEISKTYPEMPEKQAHKLAQENARYLISVFTPATTMGHTIDLRQLNYCLNWMEKFVQTAEDNEFNTLLKPCFNKFTKMCAKYKVENLKDNKNRSLSLIAKRDRKEEWGENYCCNYMVTFSCLAQAHRHRTLSYEISVPSVEKATFFVPPIIRGTNLEQEWLKDIKSLAHMYPQGMLIKVNERGTVEDFIMKCDERLCGAAQLEIAVQTKKTLEKYLENTKDTNKEVYEQLLPYSKGARCTFPNAKCTSPCIWGSKNAFERKI